MSTTWSRFREVFFARYFPIATFEVNSEEFLHLTQGWMLIQQYMARFMELSRFAPHMVSDEPKKAPSSFASIDYHRKEVVFRPLEEREFLFVGLCVRSAPQILSGMQARQLLLEGCQGYLVSVKESPKEGLKLEDIPVIRDFFNVFPENLSGLPPDREVEFAIELAPRMTPISKAPYRIAPVELKELKEQVFHKYSDKFVVVIIGDILVYSKSLAKHDARLRVVLQILKEKELFAKFKKCKFWLE
ncbi:uncharacterized protein LOC131158705 [Malania oleifera]|uniref:uncharacterized protein LOC131158705 n=1 Tax=Malania oleifera TaxID=397392 RepID=UPI0025AECD7C|nr:uncharacterized protein LOC131158705 [Malania oleifera]